MLSSYSHRMPPRPPPLSSPANICHFAVPTPLHATSSKSLSVLRPPLIPNPQPRRSRGSGSTQKRPVTLTWPIRIQTLFASVLADGRARDWVRANEGQVLRQLRQRGLSRSCLGLWCFPRSCPSAERSQKRSQPLRLRVRRGVFSPCSKLSLPVDVPARTALGFLSC